MYIRKLAAAAGFACGAALAFAPAASADLSDTVDATKAFEISQQNSLFELQALFANAGVTHATAPGQYDTLTNLDHDAPYLLPGGHAGVDIGEGATYGQVTPLETEIYGANPILAGISTGTGPYNEYNGALTEFYNSYNVYAYAAANNGALDTNPDDYLGNVHDAFLTVDGHAPTVASASEYFFNYGLGDLKGFDALFAPDATSVGDIHPYLASEIVQLNNLFEFDGKLTGDFGDIAPNINSEVGTYVNFDTIDPTKASTSFEDLVFGAAGPSTDPGSYDVLNGALTEFFNADNVGLYALLNGGDLLPQDLLLGPTDFVSGMGDTVASAITDYLKLGFSDLLGYFIPAAMGSM